MATVEEKLAKSLSAESIDLIPYLPFLLQDLWDLGSSPGDMLDMIRKHICVPEQIKVLDLACGKGAVSVFLAKKLGCTVKGIDIMPAFIEFAINSGWRCLGFSRGNHREAEEDHPSGGIYTN